MVVISRMRDEQLMIGDIVVSVVDIRGDKVRLGFDYPDGTVIHRQEVYEAIQRENARHAQSTSGQQTAMASAALSTSRPDKLAQLAEALAKRLGVAVSREVVAQSLLEAGVDA